jgi:hypothetical protein
VGVRQRERERENAKTSPLQAEEREYCGKIRVGKRESERDSVCEIALSERE